MVSHKKKPAKPWKAIVIFIVASFLSIFQTTYLPCDRQVQHAASIISLNSA
jgi:hypothetical protein